MISKSIRVPTNKTGAIANYLSSQGENEEVRWLRGCEEDVLMMGAVAKMCGRANSVRHVIKSSLEPMSKEVLADAVGEYVREFKVPPDSQTQICVVEHKKKREPTQYTHYMISIPEIDTEAGEPIYPDQDEQAAGYEYHWHIAIAEVDTETGQVLDSSHSKIRDEKVSRIIELKHGLEITLGRFNKEVYQALAEERPELDLSRLQKAMEEANVRAGFKKEDWLEYQAYSAYSSGEHQALNRALDQVSAITGIDYKEKISLPKIKSQIRAMAEASNSALDFVSAVVEAGYDIQYGRKQGVHRLWLGDVDVGSLDRLAGRGMRRAEVADAINEYYSSGGKKYEKSGNKTAEKAGFKTISKRPSGVGSIDVGERSVCVGGQSGEAEIAHPDLEYSTSRGRRGQHRITHRKAVEGHQGSKGTAKSTDGAKRSDHQGSPKPKLSAARIRANFVRARDRIHAQRVHSNYVNLSDASSSDGGGEVFDAGDFFMLSRWAADYRRKNKISGP